jgi:hypothetical protein
VKKDQEPTSEQYLRVKARYDVKTYRELLGAIRAEWKLETGQTITYAVADVLLDRMCEAEYQRMQAG